MEYRRGRIWQGYREQRRPRPDHPVRDTPLGFPAMTSLRAVSPALRSLSPTVRGSLLIVGGATFAGILGPLARLLYNAGMTPFAFVVWRGLIAGSALWLLVAWRRRSDPARHGIVLARLPRRQRLALLGFVTSNVVLNTSLFVAFDRIPIAVALLTF